MKHFFFIAVSIALIGCGGSRDQVGSSANITPAESAYDLGNDRTIVFLEVRTTEEYINESKRLEGAILIPVDTLESCMKELEPYKSKMIIVYCRSGHRSAPAQRILAAGGYRALSMDGGITQWNTKQLPVVKEHERCQLAS